MNSDTAPPDNRPSRSCASGTDDVSTDRAPHLVAPNCLTASMTMG